MINNIPKLLVLVARKLIDLSKDISVEVVTQYDLNQVTCVQRRSLLTKGASSRQTALYHEHGHDGHRGAIRNCQPLQTELTGALEGGMA
jgi:hypothetical protein